SPPWDYWDRKPPSVSPFWHPPRQYHPNRSGIDFPFSAAYKPALLRRSWDRLRKPDNRDPGPEPYRPDPQWTDRYEPALPAIPKARWSPGPGLNLPDTVSDTTAPQPDAVHPDP